MFRTLSNYLYAAFAGLLVIFFSSNQLLAQGSWVKINAPSPDYNNGVMLLLTDGSVMAKSCHGDVDTLGNLWDRLTPDATGSYVNGSWTHMAPSVYKRLYCSSQVLKDGRVYVAGGEFGNGGYKGELYDPVADAWSAAGALPAPDSILDGNSELLPDGRVLQGHVIGDSRGNYLYDPVTNSYSFGASCFGSHDEVAWVKLPDNSILMVDLNSQLSERYIPSLGRWIHDAHVPDMLYDPYGFEAGAGFLLPDGRAFFLGSLGHTAFYTPTGDTSQGTWAAGPDMPGGLGTPDAAAAMMANGHILCAVSPKPSPANEFPNPVSFCEFDYLADSFIHISAPGGGDTLSYASYATMMLSLPDGNILYCGLDSNQYWEYIPAGAQLVSGKPTVTAVTKVDCNTYIATGTLFNGISEGAAYGDDWQMATNYPIIRLRSGATVYYARTYNWNSTGLMRGSAADTVTFSLPSSLPDGTYGLEVVANGIASSPVSFVTCNASGVGNETLSGENLRVYPNPAKDRATVAFFAQDAGTFQVTLTDMFGRSLRTDAVDVRPGSNEIELQLPGLAAGMYIISLQHGTATSRAKLVVR